MNEYIYNTLHYFEVLYSINQKLIKLCGSDAIRNMTESFNITIDICNKVPIVLPYIKCKEDNKLYISKNDGILQFKDKITFIEGAFNEVLTKNYNILESIKIIRNKSEHSIHSIKFKESSSGNTVPFELIIKINNEEVTINTQGLINLMKNMNDVYSDIAILISELAIKDEQINSYYMKYLYTFDFKEFNKLYDDPNIKLIGKFQYSFNSNEL